MHLLRPKEVENCFNILVLHQNRAQHSEYGHIPQNRLPDCIDLIIWGHEHECRITPEFVPDREYFITQPGILRLLLILASYKIIRFDLI